MLSLEEQLRFGRLAGFLFCSDEHIAYGYSSSDAPDKIYTCPRCGMKCQMDSWTKRKI